MGTKTRVWSLTAESTWDLTHYDVIGHSKCNSARFKRHSLQHIFVITTKIPTVTLHQLYPRNSPQRAHKRINCPFYGTATPVLCSIFLIRDVYGRRALSSRVPFASESSTECYCVPVVFHDHLAIIKIRRFTNLRKWKGWRWVN